MLQLLNGPKNGQYVHLVTGLYRYCLSDGVSDIQGFSRIDVHSTHAHGIWRTAQIPLTSFGSK